MKGTTEEKTIKKPKDRDNGKIQANDQMEGAIHSMEDLQKAWKSEPEPVLKLPDPSSISPAEMAKQVDKIDQDQKSLRKWTIGLLSNIDQRLNEVAKEKDLQKKKITHRLATAGNEEDQALLNPYLRGDKNPFYRQVVWAAMFEYNFTKPHQS